MNYEKFLSKFDAPLHGFVERAFTSTFPDKVQSISVSPIEGGFSSAEIYKINIGGRSYVLRILPLKFQIERRMAEHEGHRIAASLGVAPKVLYTGPEGHVMIMEYIEGRPLTVRDTKDHKIMEVVAKKLRRLHDYNLPFLFKNSQKTRTERQKTKADKKHAVFPKTYDALYAHYIKDNRDGPGPDWVLGHGDLNLTNLLLTKEGGVFFIDWPNASMEHRYIELGALTFWGGMDLKNIKLFLTAYLGHPPTKKELEALSWGQRRAAFYAATLWLRFVDPDAYEHTKLFRQEEVNKRYDQKLRSIWDYHKKGEVVPIAGAKIKESRLLAMLSNTRQKRMDYGLSNLQAYENGAGL